MFSIYGVYENMIFTFTEREVAGYDHEGFSPSLGYYLPDLSVWAWWDDCQIAIPRLSSVIATEYLKQIIHRTPHRPYFFAQTSLT